MKNFLTISCLIIFFLPILTFAQGYEPLVGIPNFTPGSGFNTYINTLYALSISIAALLAVIKIIIAGVKWMMTDIVTTKGEAKKDIQGALIGLLIVLAAVLILTIINPKLVDVNLQLDTVQTKKLSPTSGSATPYFNGATIGTHDKILGFQEAGIVTGANPTDSDLKNLCENIVPEACPNGWFGWVEAKAGYPEAACYQGIYDSDKKACLVPASELKLDKFSCEKTGDNYDPEQGTTVFTYDCTTAKAACINATGKVVEVTESAVKCAY